jgi:hypothetical protein
MFSSKISSILSISLLRDVRLIQNCHFEKTALSFEGIHFDGLESTFSE